MAFEGTSFVAVVLFHHQNCNIEIVQERDIVATPEYVANVDIIMDE